MAGASKTILLAEDDPFTLRMYQTKLTAAGFTVLAAVDGRDAYEQLKASKVDLAMLDITMPEMTGFEVIAALKADGQLLPLDRIIMLTNSANPKHRQRAGELGIDYVIKAEVTPHEILDRINAKLGR
jgi:CheY-like chemotaxis protein